LAPLFLEKKRNPEKVKNVPVPWPFDCLILYVTNDFELLRCCSARRLLLLLNLVAMHCCHALRAVAAGEPCPRLPG
jgi:hypothetical protein